MEKILKLILEKLELLLFINKMKIIRKTTVVLYGMGERRGDGMTPFKTAMKNYQSFLKLTQKPVNFLRKGFNFLKCRFSFLLML